MAYRPTAPKNPLRFRSACGVVAQLVNSSCMGQRLSGSNNTMAANAEKVATVNNTGEEKTFVCAVSTGS